MRTHTHADIPPSRRAPGSRPLVSLPSRDPRRSLRGRRTASPRFEARSNHLLRSLTLPEYSAIVGAIDIVAVAPGQVLQEAGGTIDAVYFPLRGLVSLAAPGPDGSRVEVDSVGAAGCLGTPAAFGAPRAELRATALIETVAVRISLGEFVGLAGRGGPLERVAREATLRHMTNLATTATCCSRHGVVERLARWLLTASDRAGVDELPVSQHTIAELLGVRRATVSVAAHGLRAAGCIWHHHGRIAIRDRDALRRAACGC